MNSELTIEETRSPINPKKMILWILIVSIIMMFAAFTSAYLVRRGEGNWLEFALPSMFKVSTLFILLSSVTIHLSYNFLKNGKEQLANILLLLTFGLGIGFLVTQYNAWFEIYNYDYKIVFGGAYSNPSGSFLYVLSGLHAFHIISGLIFLIVLIVSQFKKGATSKKLLNFELGVTYWHFLDVLWIYLYIFLIVNH